MQDDSLLAYFSQRVQVPNVEGFWSQIPLRVWLLEPESLKYSVLGPSGFGVYVDPPGYLWGTRIGVSWDSLVGSSLHAGDGADADAALGLCRCSGPTGDRGEGPGLFSRTESRRPKVYVYVAGNI